MKFGIKIWSTNESLIKKARSHFLKGDFDFIEISAIKGSFNEKVLSLIEGVPAIIHCDNEGVNLAKKEFHGKNILAIRESQKFADFLNAKLIIVHPGHEGEISSVNKVLDEINDERICIENLPGKTYDLKFRCMGSTCEELRQIHFRHFCLDISHAIKSAITLSKEPYSLIKEMLKLKPEVLHVSDSRLDNEVDEHLNIGEGEYDFRKIFGLIKGSNSLVTLETPKPDFSSLDCDIANINRLKTVFR